MGRLIRGLGSLIGLLGLLIGVPAALVVFVGWPLPDHWPTGVEWQAWLDQPITDTVLINTAACIVWLLWAVLFLAVIAEVIRVTRRARVPAIHLPAPLHALAAGLVGSTIVTLTGGAATPAANPTPTPPPQPTTAGTLHAAPALPEGTGVLLIDDCGYLHTVRRGESLWLIAQHCLGAGEKWPQIWQLNKGRFWPAVSGYKRFDNPDLIYPNWTLRQPVSATPRPGDPQVDPTDEPPPTPPAATPTPSATPPTTAASAQPTGEAKPSNSAADSDVNEDTDEGIPVPGVLAGAGLLAALILGVLAVHRHRQRQHRRPGRRLPHPERGAVERDLRVAQQPADVARLERALRHLTNALADRPQTAVPDIVGAWLEPDAVRLILTAPKSDPPPSWRAEGSEWVLAGNVEADDLGLLAPLPTLVSVGTQHGRHLLLDLERLGALAITGDADHAAGLLRYVACELACNSWSDDVQVLLAGLPADQTAQLVTLNPDRVRPAASPADTATRLGHRADTITRTVAETDAVDTVAGRIHDLAADSWMPTVLIAAAPSESDRPALGRLADQLVAGGRCAIALAATTTPDQSLGSGARLVIDHNEQLTVEAQWLHTTVTTASLPAAQLARLADIIAQAGTTADEPVPPSLEAEPWAAGTNAAGTLLPLTAPDPASNAAIEHPNGAEPATHTTPEATMPPPDTPTSGRPRHHDDPALDVDLAAWHDGAHRRPRIAILGPVYVDAVGDRPTNRQRFLAEVIVYLASCGARGAHPDQLSEAIWPDQRVTTAYRRVVLSKARQWLSTITPGEHSDDQWLPDSGAARTYRLEDGYLLDWHLFRRLRARGESKGPDGAPDLHAALDLVRGVPLDGEDRPTAEGNRHPYSWLPESHIYPGHLISAIVDTAHQLARHYLDHGDTAAARWAVEKAWLADPQRGDDGPWLDMMRAAHTDGRTAELRTLFGQLLRYRDIEVPEDLNPTTYAQLRELLPDLLRTGVAPRGVGERF